MTEQTKATIVAALVLLVLVGALAANAFGWLWANRPPKSWCEWCADGRHVHDPDTRRCINATTGCDCDEVMV